MTIKNLIEETRRNNKELSESVKQLQQLQGIPRGQKRVRDLIEPDKNQCVLLSCANPQKLNAIVCEEGSIPKKGREVLFSSKKIKIDHIVETLVKDCRIQENCIYTGDDFIFPVAPFTSTKQQTRELEEKIKNLKSKASSELIEDLLKTTPESIANEIARITKEIDEKEKLSKTELQPLEEKLSSLQNEISQINSRLTAQQILARTLDEEISRLCSTRDAATKLLEMEKKHLLPKSTLLSEMDKELEYRNGIHSINTAFKKEFLKDYLFLKLFIPEINSSISQVLKLYLGETMLFELELSESLCMSVNDSGRKNISGGQHTRLLLAFVMSMRILIEKRLGIRTGFVFYDETTQFIDAKGAEQFVLLLNTCYLDEKKIKVIYVSHNETIDKVLKEGGHDVTTITVKRQHGYSTIILNN